MVIKAVKKIKVDLIEHFQNGRIKFCYLYDKCNQKRINTLILSENKGIIEMDIFPQENTVEFNILEIATVICGIINTNVIDTYDSELGKAFLEWFKPILRNLVCKKYSLKKEDVMSDELLGTDYCQVRTDGILPFLNLTENPFFTQSS